MKDVAAVFVGGVLGTTLRTLLGVAAVDAPWPWATFTVNVVGAFALGFLLEVLTRRGPDEGLRRSVRLALGTGLLGSFTTYSALAYETVSLGFAGLAYALASVGLGLAAAVGGISLGKRAVAR